MKNDLDSDFIPANPLEEALIAIQSGSLQMTQFLPILLRSEVFVLGKQGPAAQSFSPLQFQRAGERYIATFTAKERATRLADPQLHLLSMTGTSLFSFAPSGFGIVLNPAWTVGFELPAGGVLEVKRDFLQ